MPGPEQERRVVLRGAGVEERGPPPDFVSFPMFSEET